jgi:hypothetical protein
MSWNRTALEVRSENRWTVNGEMSYLASTPLTV